MITPRARQEIPRNSPQYRLIHRWRIGLAASFLLSTGAFAVYRYNHQFSLKNSKVIEEWQEAKFQKEMEVRLQQLDAAILRQEKNGEKYKEQAVE